MKPALRFLLFLIALQAAQAAAPTVGFAQKAAQKGKDAQKQKLKLVPFRVGPKWGFSDTAGTLVISPRYDEIEIMGNGFFKVRIERSWGVVNRAGKEISKVKYANVYSSKEYNSQDSSSQFFLKTLKKTGVIDTVGQILVPFRFKEVFHITGSFYKVGYYEDGPRYRYAIPHFGLYGFNKLLAPTIHENVDQLPSKWIKLSSTGRWEGIVSPDGRVFLYKSPYNIVSDFSEGLFAVRNYVNGKYKCEFLDINGKPALDTTFHFATAFSEGLAAICFIPLQWGYIDKNGNVVIPCVYEHAAPFQNGLAIVKKHGKLGMIDRYNNIIVPIMFDKLISSGQREQRGQAVRGIIGDKVSVAYIDSTGFIVPFGMYADFDGYDPHLIQVISEGRKYGLINRHGKELVPPIYDRISSRFSDGMAWVIRNDSLGYIDTTGKAVIPLRYHSRLKVANYAHDFIEGLAPVLKDTFIDGTTRNSFSYINKKGNPVSKFYIYDNMAKDPKPFYGGFVSVPIQYEKRQYGEYVEYINPKYGIINKHGDLISDALYTRVEIVEDGLIYICDDKGCGFIDTTGKIIVSMSKYEFIPNPHTKRPSYLHNGLLRVVEFRPGNWDGRRIYGFMSLSGKQYWKAE